MSTPTDTWLANVDGMPPLTGDAGVAERLLLLLHYGIDWSTGWVGARRHIYWDSLLPERVTSATYRTNSLRHWWSLVAEELESTARNDDQRRELEQLLRADPLPVLRLLRNEAPALILRTRITADSVRATRLPREDPT